jgi:maltoporin
VSEADAAPETDTGREAWIVGDSVPARAPEPARAPASETPVLDATHRFVFGSYGRVSVASDLAGSTGRDADFVSHGARIDEGTYAELELRREDQLGALTTRVVSTLAVAGPLFHFDGDFEDRFAVRNLYAEVDGALAPGLAVWAGSRMVRGDDVYLFDFWPLDDLNMVGGGARLRIGEHGDAALSVGLARPNDPFQRQVDLAVAPGSFVPDEVVVLDRPRLVIGARGVYHPMTRTAEDGVKLVLYGEAHVLPAGERATDEGTATDSLPADDGFVLGAQAGGWRVADRAFVNLFFRYARGLGAYDPLGVPFAVGSVIDTGRAEEIQLAVSGNWESGPFGVQIGGWWRRFRDADENVFQRGLLSEGAVSVRPHVWLGEHAGIAMELGYQGLDTTRLDERTGEPEGGGAWKVGIIPFLSPNGRGTYTRPHLRLIYALTARDEGAQALYPDADPRSRQGVEHFLGIGTEWWFDSSSYQ